MPPETESTTGQAAVSAGHDACRMPSQGFITGQELAVALGMPFGSLRAYLALLVQSKSYNLLRRLPSPRSTSSTPTPAVPRGPTDEAVTTADAGHCCHSSSSAPLAPEDRFTLNPDFMHAQSSLSLATPHSLSALCKTGGPSTTSIGEMSAFHSTIPNPTTSDTAQRQQIAAAIVSVMKKQRVLHFSELLELTRQQLSSRFQPSAQLIKVLVEDLVAREFLRRSDANISVLEYVA
ncbi:Cullin protein neddylation domain [Trypanosoma vivax]|nr:Cullin protein neddylation domain [Trypanosoma vivax]